MKHFIENQTQIYINNKDRQHVSSPLMTKALVENLNLRRPHTFSLQTLGDNGLVSAIVDTVFEDVLPEAGGSNTGSASMIEDSWSEGDRSSAHLDGERRAVSVII